MKLIRCLDVVLALSGLALAMPLMALLLLLAWVDTRSPLFLQYRVGRDGRLFRMVKFRTMRPGAASVPTHHADPLDITRFGGVLRASKLDELPQLWNVLVGDMSLVGPRPCLPDQSELIESRQRLGVSGFRPGITGLGQVVGVTMATPERLARLDARMMARLTVPAYLRYLLATVCRGRS